MEVLQVEVEVEVEVDVLAKVDVAECAEEAW